VILENPYAIDRSAFCNPGLQGAVSRYLNCITPSLSEFPVALIGQLRLSFDYIAPTFLLALTALECFEVLLERQYSKLIY
jgi:hypothetical protein